jgi:uncharacterized protein (DUF305 family)
MRTLGRFLLPVLLLAAALSLASCGGSGGSGAAQQGEDGSGGSQEQQDGRMSGMEGMDHGDMGSAQMARQMVMEDGRYSDERFIDAMVPHHQGAVEMAEVALENAEHQEIRNLAEDIVTAQEAEIEQLKRIKQQEFGTSEVPMEMSSEDMEAMGMTDPDELADKDPFDKAFIDAMIPHHKSAIAMAEVALEESDNPRIREIASAIVDAQTREIAQLKEWREEWYPQG